MNDISNIVERLQDFDDECSDGVRLSQTFYWDEHNCPDFDVFRLRREAASYIMELQTDIAELVTALCAAHEWMEDVPDPGGFDSYSLDAAKRLVFNALDAHGVFPEEVSDE